jgi:hypothetical protein
MPPAFNLSQDQTLQFNPSRAGPRRAQHTHSKQFPKKLLTREHFFTLKASPRDRRPPSPTLSGQKEPGDDPPPVPAQRLKNTKHPHASAVHIVKERRRFCGGRFRRRAHYTDRNPRVNTFRGFSQIKQLVSIRRAVNCNAKRSGQDNLCELSLSDLDDERSASGQLEVLIAHFLPIEPDSALLDHAHRFGRARGQT